jgi:ribonuclease Z
MNSLQSISSAAILAAVLCACSSEPCPTPEPCPDPAPCAKPSTEVEPRDTGQPIPPSKRTQVVMLGTGTPNPFPDRSGPSVAVVVDGYPYIVDCGPGVVRRAQAASVKVPGLDATRLDRLFITHLHSDHTAGYPDLILTPWVVGRNHPLLVYGPPGTEAMTSNILEAYEQDIGVRYEGNQPQESRDVVRAHDVEPGVVHRDDRVEVTAIEVKHGAWKHAYGYRFQTPDRRIVISGDTVAVDAIAEACDGCDVLVHEVYSKEAFDTRPPEWQVYHKASHTSTIELAAIANRARPKLLVLYHQLVWTSTPEQMVAEVRSRYDGEVVFGNDLDVF